VKDEFLTLRDPVEGSYMDRGSKFISIAFPTSTEEEINAVLQKARKDHPKARHYCLAYRLNDLHLTERSNDDGEPSGTAGKPMLGQLVRNDLWNVALLVIRYFGGTKLGVPGLIDAYRQSAADALEKATIISRKVYALVEIEMAYEHHPQFHNFCKANRIMVRNEQFNSSAIVTLAFPRTSIHEELIHALRQFSKMDFPDLKVYCEYLGFTLKFPEGWEII
jgi:uncharacterized YigZ family protein